MSGLTSRVFELFHVKSGTTENGRLPVRTLVLGIKYYHSQINAQEGTTCVHTCDKMT